MIVMKCDEFILVSDRQREHILAFQKEDHVLWKKHRKLLNQVFTGCFLEFGFYKFTVKSYFFGLVKEVECEKLNMSI